MTLTQDQKVQIFCAALSANLQVALKVGLEGGKPHFANPVDAASLQAAQAIAKLQSKEWA